MDLRQLLQGEWCYVISGAKECVDENGFIPSIVVRGRRGHYPMLGQGKYAIPWYWGKTKEEAEQTCAEMNKEVGLSERNVALLVGQSMRENFRRRY